MKRVLVTGATGFIGRHCLPLLKNRGFEINAITLPNDKIVVEGVNCVPFNLLENAGFHELLAELKPSHLLHFAWVTAPGHLWDSRDNITWLKKSIELLEAFALQGGKRAVFSGTCAEYDWNSSLFEEYKSTCLPQTLYGSSKLALQLVVEALAKQMGFSQAWGRVFYLYGPHEYPQRFVPAVIQGLLQKKDVPCSHGNQVRDFLHVEDVADAFITLLDSDVEGVVNIGSGQGITLKQVIDHIVQRLGGADLIQLNALASPRNEPARLVATTDRLRNELGWSPRWGLEEGLKNTISWWERAMSDVRV